MRIVTKGLNTVVVSLTWNDFNAITGIPCDYDSQKDSVKEGAEFSTIKFASSVRDARLAWETKAKMKELLKECEENLNKVFFLIQPL